MKRWHVVALVALAAILVLPGVAKAEDWAIEDSGGNVFIWDGDQGIYRHVPDATTAFAMGLTWCGSDWCEVVHYNSANDAGNCCGDDWGGGGGSSCDGYYELEGDPGSGAVYLRDAVGVYHHIPDVDTANAIGIDWNNIDFCGTPGSVGEELPSVDDSDSYLSDYGTPDYSTIIDVYPGKFYWPRFVTLSGEPEAGDECSDENDEYVRSDGEILVCEEYTGGLFLWTSRGYKPKQGSPHVGFKIHIPKNSSLILRLFSFA